MIFFLLSLCLYCEFLSISIVNFSLVLAMASLWHVKVLLQLCAKPEDDKKNEWFVVVLL
jgi:hypothetical protein